VLPLQFYYLFGFLFLVFIILIITCAEITIVLCYFQLCSEDYHWWCAEFACLHYNAMFYVNTAHGRHNCPGRSSRSDSVFYTSTTSAGGGRTSPAARPPCICSYTAPFISGPSWTSPRRFP